MNAMRERHDPAIDSIGWNAYLKRRFEHWNRITEQLGDNLPIRDLKLDGEQEKMIRGFQFLTQKPVLVIINSDEENFGKNKKLVMEIEKRQRVIEFAGKFEMELSQLNDQGLMRLEGKKYIVQDGDVLNIRFNI